MAVITSYISIATQGQGDIIDITLDAQKIITGNKIQDELLCLFVPGSTAAITTIEFEPGLQ
ncbi:MAG: YjbQ family protein, partial [Spirochaetes bacterium]|nr:YjbQ family protein [Spirochaetota bacterium]